MTASQRKRWLAAWFVLIVHAGPVPAEPYRPAADGEVLETLPAGSAQTRLNGVGLPDRLDQAILLARQYIQLGRAESDPRHYGRAEAILAPWLNSTPPLPEVLVLAATLWQNRHAFAAALTALDTALAGDPLSAQAWLLRASILEVQGDYPGALRSCLALSKLGLSLRTAVCFNSGLSLSGQAGAAYVRLKQSVTSSKAPASERRWALTTLAEMAERLHKPDEAQRWYQEALNSGAPDAYLLATYSDFLLQQHRPEAVVDLLANMTRADTLLLRLTLAEQQLHHRDFETHAHELAQRFAASRARGDTTHQGDESRYTLHIAQDAQSALQLAQSNWAVQREPRDALILLEAAAAAERPGAMQPVIAFLRQTHLEDQRIAQLLAQQGLSF